ncbi:MAG: hypothetical protein WBC51_06345 [Vicinamibacterales bacterium]
MPRRTAQLLLAAERSIGMEVDELDTELSPEILRNVVDDLFAAAEPTRVR